MSDFGIPIGFRKRATMPTLLSPQKIYLRCFFLIIFLLEVGANSFLLQGLLIMAKFSNPYPEFHGETMVVFHH